MAGKATGGKRYLEMRGQTWWFQMAIPAECRDYFGGKSVHRIGLGTGDIKVAVERRDDLERDTRKLFADIRSGKAISAGRLSAAERGAMYREALRQLKENPPDYDKGLEEGQLTLADILQDHAQEEAEKLDDKEQRDFTDAYAGRVGVGEYLEPFLKSIGLAYKTTDEKRGLVKRFAQWCDREGLKLEAIDRKAVGKYVTAEIEPMHFRTAKKHMAALRGYWDYLWRRGYVDLPEARDNPWNDQLQPNKGRKGGRKPEPERAFTTDEVRALLYGDAEATTQLDDTTRKIMTIGLLTGMREAEIVTLKVENIVADAGDGYGRVFDVTDSKTDAGVRKVPIHPDLNGLVDALTNGKAKGDWLFDEYAKMPNPSDTFGKRFRRYREARGVDDKQEGRRRSLVNFHSARRWFATEAERAEQPPHIISLVVGHEEGRKGITLSVYSGGGSGGQRRACVEAVKLPRME